MSKKNSSYCEICNKKLYIFKKLENFDLCRCDDCDHVVSDLRVNKKYYKKTYSNSYVETKHKNWMNNPNYKLFKEINMFIKSKKNGKILDLGCGTGLLLKYLSKENSTYNLTGVDIMAKNSKKNSKITFIKKEIFKFTPKKKFSFVVSIAVIEHVPKLKLFINHLKKISNKGSSFIILTVNTNSFLYKIANYLFYFNIKTPFLRLYDPHHLNHFSNKSLEKLFIRNGFEITKKIKSNVSMKQIDYEYSNVFIKYFLYFGLLIILKTEDFFNKSWLQTVIFTKKN
jgi:2-polyprenyl-3-methyl-5-hydroxy-6-metoxy-1,4-benzoquinol methylase